MKNSKDLKIIIAITGASGAVYARLLVRELLKNKDVAELAVVFSRNGRAVAEYEGQVPDLTDERIKVFDVDDMFSAPASGSAGYDAMVIVPCSMGTAGRVANGISGDLIARAADVMLKERRKLIMVVRETPLNAIHLRNMTALSECGAVILPASPSFYSLPETPEDICMTVVERVMSHLGFKEGHFVWGFPDFFVNSHTEHE